MRKNYMNNNAGNSAKNHIEMMHTHHSADYGNDPFVTNIEMSTLKNSNFRSTLWTGTYYQLTLMCINPGDSIGLEIHPKTDQFLRIEEGVGKVMMGKNKENLSYQKMVKDGFAIFVPAGTWHNLLNTGRTPLKLYSIYAPPHHPKGTLHKTKQDALRNEHNHH